MSSGSKLPWPVARDVDPQRPVLGQHGLAAGAVAVVGRIAGLVGTGRVAQVMAEFGTQDAFDQGLLERHRSGIHRFRVHRATDHLVNEFFRDAGQRRCRFLLARLAWHTCSFWLTCYASHTKFLTGSRAMSASTRAGCSTEAVTKKPHAVLLLDEIEKAHPDIFNILLQVMDHGTLTDNNGRKADFRNVVIVMTTNAGAEALQKTSIGFTSRTAGRRRDGRDQAHVHARVPQPAGRHHLLRGARRRDHPARGGQVPDAAGRPAAREEGRGDLHRCAERTGWPKRASIR